MGVVAASNAAVVTVWLGWLVVFAVGSLRMVLKARAKRIAAFKAELNFDSTFTPIRGAGRVPMPLPRPRYPPLDEDELGRKAKT